MDRLDRRAAGREERRGGEQAQPGAQWAGRVGAMGTGAGHRAQILPFCSTLRAPATQSKERRGMRRRGRCSWTLGTILLVLLEGAALPLLAQTGYSVRSDGNDKQDDYLYSIDLKTGLAAPI